VPLTRGGDNNEPFAVWDLDGDVKGVHKSTWTKCIFVAVNSSAAQGVKIASQHLPVLLQVQPVSVVSANIFYSSVL
jgi:hypothetical protein